MRICLYTETALPKLGGQETVVDALARPYVQLGHQVTLLAPYPRLPLRVADGDFPYQVVRHLRFYSTRWFVSRYQYFLRRLFRRSRFDILHCHGLYPSGYLAALCKSRLNVPTVLTSHGGDVYENNVRIRKPILRARHELAVRSADRLIAISQFTHDGFLRLGGSESRIVDLPNGVDLEAFAAPAKRPENLDSGIQPGKYLLFVGRLARRKGVDVLLRSLSQLPKSPFVRLVVAGDGDERSALQRLTSELGLTDQVRFIGAAHGQTKTYLFQNALCITVPSRSWEAFGLIVLESYAASKPVIATRLPGLADLVQVEKTGELVHPESADELAQAMQRMIENPARTGEMGNAAFRFAAGYSWRAIANRHIALYEELRGCTRPQI
jgi:glycosyltransferase involved in cell wall biosynthesis